MMVRPRAPQSCRFRLGLAVGPAGRGRCSAPAGNTKTVTIIDGKTGTRQEILLPGTPEPSSPPDAPAAAEAVPNDQKLVEVTPQGPIPKIAANGMRPAEAYAQPVKPIPGKPDAPRVALVVGGLGVSANITQDAISKLPGAVTLAFMPYSYDVDHLAGRARRAGHEILLQAPMEPFELSGQRFRPADAADHALARSKISSGSIG